MTAGELYSFLDERFPVDLRAEWDNDGLMYCLDKNKSVKKVLITLDVTVECIEYAAKNGYDTIVSHHPLIFRPLSCLDFSGAVGKRLKMILKNDITVMSFHTRLDCCLVNQSLAEVLGFENIREFELDGLPMGRIGEIGAMNIEAFAEHVKKALGADTVNYPACFNKPIKKVALLGGSGGDAVGIAAKLGADALVTGECSYNKVIDCAEMGLAVITAGHFHTENHVCKYLKNIIDNYNREIECGLYHSNFTENI